MLVLMHQHVKNASGKLMNIRLKFFPKILTHRKEIKTLKTKDAAVGCVWSTPMPFLSPVFLLSPKP